jgi:hypothetical protein
MTTNRDEFFDEPKPNGLLRGFMFAVVFDSVMLLIAWVVFFA